jgi:hypothetical protein
MHANQENATTRPDPACQPGSAAYSLLRSAVRPLISCFLLMPACTPTRDDQQRRPSSPPTHTSNRREPAHLRQHVPRAAARLARPAHCQDVARLCDVVLEIRVPAAALGGQRSQACLQAAPYAARRSKMDKRKGTTSKAVAPSTRACVSMGCPTLAIHISLVLAIAITLPRLTQAQLKVRDQSTSMHMRTASLASASSRSNSSSAGGGGSRTAGGNTAGASGGSGCSNCSTLGRVGADNVAESGWQG